MPRVELLQEQLLDALKLQLTRSHSSDPQLFSNLLMKLTELRAVGMYGVILTGTYRLLGAKHREVLEWFQMNSSRLRLPALYAEIYNIHDERSTLVTTADECNRQQPPPSSHHQFVVLPPPPPYYPTV
jgi:nuclear receptor subfamily 1 group D protein 3